MSTRNHNGTTFGYGWLVAVSALGLFGCQGDAVTSDPPGSNFDNVGDDDDQVGDDDQVETTSTALTGVVRDAMGQPLEAVTVRTNSGLSTTTNADGRFLFDNLQPQTGVLVSFEKAGFAKTQTPIDVLEDVENTLLQTLAVVDFTATFSAADGLSFTIEEGGPQVALPAGAFVDAQGNAYAGNVHVEATFYDIRSPLGTDGSLYEGSEIFAVPGDFTAIDAAGADQRLESFGMFQVNLTDDAGNEVNLASGSSAPVTMPMWFGEGAEMPAVGSTVPAWSYDESSGKWVEEGIGTVVDLGDGSYGWQFNAPHFSTWNCDQPLPTHGCVTGRVTNSQGTPRAGATVRAVGISYTSTTTARTDQNGNFCLEVKNGETVWMEISYTVGGQPATQRTDPVTIPGGQASCSLQGSPCIDIGTVPVDIMTCASGVVINSQGMPVANANISSPQGGVTQTDANGSFCLAVPVFQTTDVFVVVEQNEVGYVPVRMFTQPGLPNCQGGCGNIAVLRPFNNVSCASGEVVISGQPAGNTLVDIYDARYPSTRVMSTLTDQDGSFCAMVPAGMEVRVQVGSGQALCDAETFSTQGMGGEVCDGASQSGECTQLGQLSCNP